MFNSTLIVTGRGDSHEIVVSYCLKEAGFDVVTMYADELVSDAHSSLKIDSGSLKWHYRNDYENVDLCSVGTVWLRKIATPRLPQDELHPDDHEVARKEVAEYGMRYLGGICPQARWVNPLKSLEASCSKFAQLIAAQSHGLSVPETLISNDAAEIRAFLSASSETIYKSMAPMRWHEQRQAFAMATAVTSVDQLPSDRLLQIIPGIYQRRLHKLSDIRVVFMGRKYVAIRIPKASNPGGEVDIRLVEPQSLIAQTYELPGNIKQRCQQLMRHFGMEFAIFDLLETLDREIFFLEINPGGQFLYLEESAPQAGLLKGFLEFLTQGKYTEDVILAEVMQSSKFKDFAKTRMSK